jgi:pyruvate/2-oxoglutarate dehydrogenase complex dihydrolipoamide acyltransferase (E2) component
LCHRRNEAFQARYGLKLGITSFFVKASISALKAFPRLNAEIQGDEIVLKRYYDIGVAVGAEEGQVLIRPMRYVALSYDHRIVDGREAVQFLVHVKELIENPERLLLEG